MLGGVRRRLCLLVLCVAACGSAVGTGWAEPPPGLAPDGTPAVDTSRGLVVPRGAAPPVSSPSLDQLPIARQLPGAEIVLLPVAP